MPKLTDRFLTSFKPAPGKKDRLSAPIFHAGGLLRTRE